VAFPDDARRGDLAFFGDEENKITHVGIVLDQGMILHESGSVHIDKLDQEGIFNREKKIYTHKLRLIKDPFHE
jgi:cell wall-associated NlpC family hydrolase